jgi:hypothetical protein
MASIRIVHSPAPADAPDADLHIWTLPEQTGTFNTPTAVTNELAEFMGLLPGSKATQADVVRSIHNYAKTHKLLDHQTIRADNKLITLLNPEPFIHPTILTLNRYLRKHITPHSRPVFHSWWTERDQPLWVGINLDPSRLFNYEAVYRLLQSDTYKDLTVVVYADVRWDDAAGEGPCGCGGTTPCDYHRYSEDDVAQCGCSDVYKIKCPYHAAISIGVVDDEEAPCGCLSGRKAFINHRGWEAGDYESGEYYYSPVICDYHSDPLVVQSAKCGCGDGGPTCDYHVAKFAQQNAKKIKP